MAKKRGQVTLTRRKEPVAPPPSTDKNLVTSEQDNKTAKPKKERLTIYLAKDTADRLDLAQMQVKQLTGAGGYLIKISNLVEIGLQKLLDDFDANPSSSYLVQEVAQQKHAQDIERAAKAKSRKSAK